MLKRLLLAIFFGALLGLLTCSGLWWGIASLLPDPTPPAQPAIDQTHEILAAVARSSIEQMPTALPSNNHFSLERCWPALQNLMQSNHGEYEIIVKGVFGDAGTKIPGTGTTEVVIHVTFPDGSTLLMVYYAYTLSTCQRISPS